MTIKQSLIWATKKLKKSKIASPTLDAEILLSFVIKKPKEFLYAHSEKNLTMTQSWLFKKLIVRRAKHEPVAYILGHKFFYGLDFFVDKNVLIPRPETEILAEEVLKIPEQPPHPTLSPPGRGEVRGDQSLMIVDVGTGSGAIAVALANNIPNTKIFATEISPGAAKMAQKNIKHHKAAITLLRGNLLEPFIKKYKTSTLKSLVIVANLPYLTTYQWQKTQPEIKKYEPRQALDGGKDGLKYYKQLLQQIKLLVTHYSLPVTSLLEIDPSQAKRIKKIIKRDFPTAKIEIKKDLAGRDRLVIFSLSF